MKSMLSICVFISTLLLINNTSLRTTTSTQMEYTQIWEYCSNKSIIKEDKTHPVCGLKATGLTSEFSSAKKACKPNDFISYIRESCKGTCNPNVAYKCSLIWEPVCARKGNQELTLNNGCMACGFKFTSYTKGPCVHYCPNNKLCKGDDKPVCGYSNGGFKQFDNGYSACSANVKYYFDGPCPHICTKQEKESKFCTKEYMPKCALHADGHYSTYSNACMACIGEDVLSHINGSCDEQSYFTSAY